MKKRILSILTCLALCLSLLPATASPALAYNYFGDDTFSTEASDLALLDGVAQGTLMSELKGLDTRHNTFRSSGGATALRNTGSKLTNANSNCDIYFSKSYGYGYRHGEYSPITDTTDGSTPFWPIGNVNSVVAYSGTSNVPVQNTDWGMALGMKFEGADYARKLTVNLDLPGLGSFNGAEFDTRLTGDRYTPENCVYDEGAKASLAVINGNSKTYSVDFDIPYNSATNRVYLSTHGYTPGSNSPLVCGELIGDGTVASAQNNSNTAVNKTIGCIIPPTDHDVYVYITLTPSYSDDLYDLMYDYAAGEQQIGTLGNYWIGDPNAVFTINSITMTNDVGSTLEVTSVDENTLLLETIQGVDAVAEVTDNKYSRTFYKPDSTAGLLPTLEVMTKVGQTTRTFNDNTYTYTLPSFDYDFTGPGKTTKTIQTGTTPDISSALASGFADFTSSGGSNTAYAKDIFYLGQVTNGGTWDATNSQLTLSGDLSVPVYVNGDSVDLLISKVSGTDPTITFTPKGGTATTATQDNGSGPYILRIPANTYGTLSITGGNDTVLSFSSRKVWTVTIQWAEGCEGGKNLTYGSNLYEAIDVRNANGERINDKGTVTFTAKFKSSTGEMTDPANYDPIIMTGSNTLYVLTHNYSSSERQIIVTFTDTTDDLPYVNTTATLTIPASALGKVPVELTGYSGSTTLSKQYDGETDIFSKLKNTTSHNITVKPGTGAHWTVSQESLDLYMTEVPFKGFDSVLNMNEGTTLEVNLTGPNVGAGKDITITNILNNLGSSAYVTVTGPDELVLKGLGEVTVKELEFTHNVSTTPTELSVTREFLKGDKTIPLEQVDLTNYGVVSGEEVYLTTNYTLSSDLPKTDGATYSNTLKLGLYREDGKTNTYTQYSLTGTHAGNYTPNKIADPDAISDFTTLVIKTTITPAAALTIPDVAASVKYTKNSITGPAAANGSDAGIAGTAVYDATYAVTYAAGGAATVTRADGGTATTTVTDGWTVNETTGQVTASFANGQAGDTITFPITVSCWDTDKTVKTHADSTVNVVITLTERDGQTGFAVTTKDVASTTMAYGPIGLTLETTGGNGTGAVTYESSDESVLTVDGDGKITTVGAGTATVTATKAGDADYEPATATIVLTVEKADFGIQPSFISAGAIRYGQTLAQSAITDNNGVMSAWQSPVTGTWTWSDDTTQPLATGSHSAVFTPDSEDDKKNYNTLTHNISVTVEPATPTITVTPNHHIQTHGKSVTVTVTAANPHDADLTDVPTQFTLTYQIGNDTTVYTITGDTFTIPADTAAGTEITITATSDAVTGKYEAGSGTAKVAVTDKQVPNLTAAAFTKVYDGNPVTIGDITKSAKDDDGKDILGTWSFDNGKEPENVLDSGSWTLKFTPTDTATYASETVDVQVTITKGAITATVTMANWTVGETASEPSVTSTPSTDSYTVHYKVKGADDSTYTTTKPTEVGNYTVRVTVAGNDNYEGATATADFSILAAEPDDDGGYTPPSTTPSTPSTPGTPSVVSVTVPISGDDNTIHVEASVSGDKATIDEVDLTKLDTVIGDDVATGVVTIDFSGLKTSEPITTVEIPADVVKQIAQAVSDPNNDAESLEIVFTDGTSIEFDAEALGEKSAQADGLDVTISIKHAEDAKPTAAQEEVIGDRPAFDITVTSGGKPISDMGGSVTVHAPYELREGEDPRGIVVWYVDESGNQEACETSYDSVKKRVNWKTDHLSLYMIGYDEELAKSCPKDETCPMYPYTDVDVNAWYHDAVHYCMENGLMGSTSTTESLFAPDATASRAMIATILHRLEGTPQPTTTGTFTDVADGLWYTEAVEWAAENGIVLGYNGKFDPDDPITREQLAVMLWRYAGSPAVTTTELDFTDADEVSDWAMDALIWAQESGVMQGYNNAVDPQGTATRSCVAQMFKNLLENVLK